MMVSSLWSPRASLGGAIVPLRPPVTPLREWLGLLLQEARLWKDLLRAVAPPDTVSCSSRAGREVAGGLPESSNVSRSSSLGGLPRCFTETVVKALRGWSDEDKAGSIQGSLDHVWRRNRRRSRPWKRSEHRRLLCKVTGASRVETASPVLALRWRPHQKPVQANMAKVAFLAEWSFQV